MNRILSQESIKALDKNLERKKGASSNPIITLKV